jgi:6-phospho-3-hexuloisomerase
MSNELIGKLLQAVHGELTAALAAVTDADLHSTHDMLTQARRIFVAGKGRTGLQMRGFAMRLMHCGLQVHVVDDVTTPAITSNDVLVIGSGSGRTPSLVGYAQRAKRESAPIVLITGAAQSPIEELAKFTVHIAAPSPKTTAQPLQRTLPMGGLFELSLILFLESLIVEIMRSHNINEQEMFARHANLE